MNKEKESPFNNPRFLLVLAVTFVALWGWQYYLNKKYPPVAPTAKTAVTSSEETKKETAGQPKADATTLKNQDSNQSLPIQKFDYTDGSVSFSISSLGFGFVSFELNDYKDHDGKQIQFVQDGGFYILQVDQRPVVFDISVSVDKLTYTGVARVDGKEIKRVLKYDPLNKAFMSSIHIPEGVDQIRLAIEQNKVVPVSENFLMPSYDHQDFVYVTEGKTHSERISSVKNEETMNKTAENVTLASVGSQYFVSALVNKSDIAPRITNKVEGHKAYLFVDYNLKNIKISELNQIFYIGAKKVETLQAIDSTLPDVMNYGIFGFISKILLNLLKLIHSVVGNWGVAIIILTIVVRSVLLPFNVMSFRSAQAMQKIKPKMDAIKERYKSDPMRVNKETMALMKENNANPLSGCLPMLLQIPIFFAFFAAISTSVELYHQPFFGWITDLSSRDHYFILPILMGVTMFFQQKLTPTTMDPMQAKILNFMPLIFTLFMVTLPSGLTLYNFVSALFGVIQQFFLLRDTKVKSS